MADIKKNGPSKPAVKPTSSARPVSKQPMEKPSVTPIKPVVKTPIARTAPTRSAAEKSRTPSSSASATARTERKPVTPIHTEKSAASKAEKTATAHKPVTSSGANRATARNAESKAPAEVVKTDAILHAERRSAERAEKNRALAEEMAAAKRSAAVKRAVDNMAPEKKKELEEKVKAEKQTRSAKNSGGAAAKQKSFLDRKKLIIIAAAVLVAFVIILTVVLVSCNGGDGDSLIVGHKASNSYEMQRPSDNIFVDERDIAEGNFTNQYKNRTKVGYQAEYLGNVTRKLPDAPRDEGLVTSGVIDAYPRFGYTSNYNADQKTAVIGESWQLSSINTRIGSDGYPKNTYNKIDSEGNLYLNGEDTGRDLYKHTSAAGMYYGNVSDDEPAIIKKLTYAPRGYASYNVTGLYAPAGEVIKVEITETDMDATAGIVVHIGQALYNNKANNIWAARAINRMPVILNTLILDKSTCTFDSARGVWTGYIGSYCGGPIYVCNENITFSVTISGGVRYAHFILGYTTPEEYEENMRSTAPYYDLEVREFGVLHSGPKASAGAANITYDNIYKAAVLWEKISLVSTQRSRQGIVFLYDPFVAAGAAVAFPGQRAVNCPAGWMSGSLNYNAMVSSGSWGNLHEYNHNFQGYGCNGNDGEVTNNAITLVEYSLFTKISAARQIGAYGGAGLGGWNSYTSATWALDRVNRGEIGGTSGLAMYATLLHNFGQEAFMSASLGGRGVSYFNKWGEVTHHNMAYFLELAKVYSLSGDGTNNTIDYSSLQETQKDYPMFVPASCVYQTGRSYVYDGVKKYITTMRPYRIKFGEAFDIDLNPYTEEGGMYKSGSVVMPEGFTYTVKKIVAPQYGKLTSKGNNIFTYMPDGKQLFSGKIVVTLSVKKNDNAFKVEDIDLVLEFEQTHEMNRNMLERTVYTYADDSVPESSQAAFEAGFAGAQKVTADNVNPVQNGNTEIWSTELLSKNSFYEVRGKMYVGETGDYRIALRGRWDCALYTSVNDENKYELSAKIQTNETHANFYLNVPETYKDMSLKAGDWVYFRAILKGDYRGKTNAYIGVGWGMFVPPQGVIDENGNLIGSDGNIIENPQPTINITYANAYRASYESIPQDFESDYFFLRDYKYNYIESKDVSDGQTVVDTNYTAWTDGVTEGWYDISHLFDGKSDTWVHTHRNFYVSANNPLYLNVDMGKTVTATHFNLTCWTEKNMTNIGMPKAFKLEFMDEKNNKIYEKEFTGVSAKNKLISVNLESSVTFRYYKLTVTATDNGRFAATNAGFTDVFSLPAGSVIEADNAMFAYNGEWTTESGLYTFGHLYKGEEGASVKFTFNGTNFGVFAYKAPGYGSFEVYIDGKKRGTVDLSGSSGPSELVYLSDGLNAGKHRVELRCVTGTINLDNIVLWQ